MRCPNSCGARPGSVSPVCQFAESERPGVAPGGVTTTLTEASAGVLVPGTNSRSSEWLGSSAFANRNEFHTRVMSDRHCGTRGWFGEPVNRMLTVTWSRSGRSRQVNAAGPPVIVPSARCSQSNCSRPTSTGPDTASRAVHVSGPTTPSSPSGGVRVRWNCFTASRVWPPNLPSTSSRVGTWSGGTVLSFCCSSSTAGPVEFRRMVGWIVPPSGAPRGSPSAGPSTTLRP